MIETADFSIHDSSCSRSMQLLATEAALISIISNPVYKLFFNDIAHFIEQSDTWGGKWEYKRILNHQQPLELIPRH